MRLPAVGRVGGQMSNEVQSSNVKEIRGRMECWNIGILGQTKKMLDSLKLFHHSTVILLNFGHFDIHLPFELGHLTFYSSLLRLF